jgi:hypothetical protein
MDVWLKAADIAAACLPAEQEPASLHKQQQQQQQHNNGRSTNQCLKVVQSPAINSYHTKQVKSIAANKLHCVGAKPAVPYLRPTFAQLSLTYVSILSFHHTCIHSSVQSPA